MSKNLTDCLIRLYTVALSAGVSGGIIIAGLITITHSWRYIYYVATALMGALTILVFFTLPETSYVRDPLSSSDASLANHDKDRLSHEERQVGNDKLSAASYEEAEYPPNSASYQDQSQRKRESFVQSLRLFHGKFTEESLWNIAYRPIILLVLPPVLWATLVMSVTIEFLVAMSSNFASAFATQYGFKSWQSGLCFISGMIGTLIGIVGGGWFSDWTADFFTRRNNGIREPGMRLPAITVTLICAPLALVLYGCGIEYQWHWIVPTIGLGLCKSLPTALTSCLPAPFFTEQRNLALWLTYNGSELCCRVRD